MNSTLPMHTADGQWDEAQTYAKRNWRVLPLYHLLPDGGCSCGRPDCEPRSRGKHPRISKWQTGATTDLATIRKWARAWPQANIGVQLGEQSGIIDVEYDDEIGREVAERILGDIHTPTYRSGSRSIHRLFGWQPGLPGGAKILIDGLEIRCGNDGKGAQSVFPPSIHPTGSRYEWIIPPDQAEPAAIPPALLQLIANSQGDDDLKDYRQDSSDVDDRELALQALAGLSEARAVDYEQWLYVGMALHGVDSSQSMLTEWDTWSQSCRDKYEPGACAEKWTSFNGSGWKIGSLIYWAKQDGWKQSRRTGRRYLHSRGTGSNGKNAESFPLTDTGLAERFALQHGDSVRYCYPWGKYLCWDGTRWKLDDQGAVDQLAKQTVRSILREAADEPDDDRSKALVAFAKTAESASRRDAMLKMARSEPPIPINPNTLDKDAWIFNCPNGGIDLRTGHLCEHRREDYITKLCPVEYHPDALCPLWLKTLDKIFSGDKEVIIFLQRFVGYGLTGDVSEQILNIWHGVGANGKSTVANTIMEMFGTDYSMKAAADLLLQKCGGEHPTALTDLHGKRFVACIETEDNRRLAESLVKELTGGDPIRARRMREDFWQFMPTHKVILACNHRPTVRGTDHAIWRRLKLVPFNVVIPKQERDKALPTKLRAELPGILAWAVRGCLDWQQHGLGEPKAVIDATADYQSTEDTLRNFIAECCVTDPDSRVKAAELVEAYREWSGEKHTTVRKLTGMLIAIGGIERQKSSGLWYRGVGLLDTVERE